MNDTWRCSVFKKCNLSDVSTNVEVSKSTENRGCSFVNSERSQSESKTTLKKKRDREPSRIPVHKFLKLLNKRKYRKRVEYLSLKSVPNSSFMKDLCRNYKNWHLWHNSENFYSKFVFFMRKVKYKSTFKYCRKIYCEQFSVIQAEFESKSNYIKDIYTTSCDFSFLKGGMAPDIVSDNSPWAWLTERVAHISLKPYDVGGSGDCFFKSVSHQLYGTPQLHFQIRMTGIRHLNDYPQLYIESISNNCWENYIQQMSTPGTWCDNIIIQAVANAHNCVIHITESDINKPDGTIITPVVHQGQPNTIFIGYINELHYVSTVPDKNNQNKNRIRYLKSKLKKRNDEKQSRVAKRRKTRSSETDKENWTPIMEQKHVAKNLDLFHKSNEYSVHQCTVCLEAWPLASNGNSSTTSQYICLRCTRDKKHPKKFSKENNMIPSEVPSELQGLTQVEEMLIARALPIMRVYIKPGGQRGYSGHCINLPRT